MVKEKKRGADLKQQLDTSLEQRRKEPAPAAVAAMREKMTLLDQMRQACFAAVAQVRQLARALRQKKLEMEQAKLAKQADLAAQERAAAAAAIRAKQEEAERKAFQARFGTRFGERTAKQALAYTAAAVPELRKAGQQAEADLLEKYGPKEIERKRAVERKRLEKSRDTEQPVKSQKRKPGLTR